MSLQNSNIILNNCMITQKCLNYIVLKIHEGSSAYVLQMCNWVASSSHPWHPWAGFYLSVLSMRIQVPIRALSSFCPMCHDAESELDLGHDRDCDRASGYTALPMCLQGHVCCHRVSGGSGGFVSSDLSVRHRVMRGNFTSVCTTGHEGLRKALPCSCIIPVAWHSGSPAAAAVILRTQAKMSITLCFPWGQALLKALPIMGWKFQSENALYIAMMLNFM